MEDENELDNLILLKKCSKIIKELKNEVIMLKQSLKEAKLNQRRLKQKYNKQKNQKQIELIKKTKVLLNNFEQFTELIKQQKQEQNTIIKNDQFLEPKYAQMETLKQNKICNKKLFAKLQEQNQNLYNCVDEQLNEQQEEILNKFGEINNRLQKLKKFTSNNGKEFRNNNQVNQKDSL